MAKNGYAITNQVIADNEIVYSILSKPSDNQVSLICKQLNAYTILPIVRSFSAGKGPAYSGPQH